MEVLLVPVLLRLRLQIGFDEHVNVAVEHALDVADFDFGPLVLGQAVRLENVRSNLTAESDTQLAVFNGLRFGLLLLHVPVRTAGREAPSYKLPCSCAATVRSDTA